MIFYIDFINKIIYIMAPKCGTTTISNILNVDLHKEYSEVDLNNLNNPEYKKIIIIRESVIDRFLSGFYEDLFNNSCYDNMNITFNDYLIFLYNCYKEKKPNVNNININNINIPVWFGNCSNQTLNITDKEGNFCSHIMSQKYAISNIVNMIECKNIKIIDLKNLSDILPKSTKKFNIKEKIEKLPDKINFSEISLSYIKSNRLIISSKFLNEKQKEIILDIYKEDLLFFNELEEKFKS